MPTGSGGGLASVQTNTTLSGTGTASSPLSVRNWPLTYFSTGLAGANGSLLGANAVTIQGFYLPAALTFSRIVVQVGASDAVNNYDFGLYNVAGTLLANRGPGTVPATGVTAYTMLQGAQTINPGTYLFAWVGAATTAQIVFNSVCPCAVFNNNVATAVSATLPASIGAVALAPTVNAYQLSFY